MHINENGKKLYCKAIFVNVSLMIASIIAIFRIFSLMRNTN